MTRRRIAVITGGNRGLGLEAARQLALRGDEVIIGVRTTIAGRAAARFLRAQGLHVSYVKLDVSRPRSVHAACAMLLHRWGHIDVLVNNAGVLLEGNRRSGYKSILDPDLALSLFDATIAVNLRGPLLMTRSVLPRMLEFGTGRIVNVSSGMGRLVELDADAPFYRLSKAALNALTRISARAAAGNPDVLVNAVCPGWIKTRMGGRDAERTVEEGAASVVWATLLPKGGPSGELFRDGKPFSWEGAI
jgi:NAD(P)-dependent dehydrogenase (short-subunit alcohol dehydrogenase family)